MSVRVGINGFGRIGRNVVRAAKASGADIDIVAVNDLTDPKSLAHLFKYDSILGPYAGEVTPTEHGIVIDGDEMKVFAERDPGALDWGSVGAEVVIESTGFFTAREDASKHLGDSVLLSVRSLTATNSMSAPDALAARKTLRPMRPKPLMPTRTGMWRCSWVVISEERRPPPKTR